MSNYESKFIANLNNIELVVHNSSIRYLAGISPENEWGVRGLSAHSVNDDFRSPLQQEITKIPEYLASQEGKERMVNFLQTATNVYIGMIQNKTGWVTKGFLGGKKISFVLGYMRTGGSYALSELCRIHGYNYKDYLQSMTHDSIPKGGAMHFTNSPTYLKRTMFDLCQYLVWVADVQKTLPHVVLKSINSSFCIPLYNGIFGEDARYFITVRDPLHSAESFRKMVKADDDNVPDLWINTLEYNGLTNREEWAEMDYYEKAILWWKYLYERVAHNLRPVKQYAYVAHYGKDMQDKLVQYAKDHGVNDYEPKDMNPAKEYNFSDKHLEIAKKATDYINTCFNNV